MNPLRHIDWDWFWGTLLVLMLALLAYTIANDPGPRPTEPAEVR